MPSGSISPPHVLHFDAVIFRFSLCLRPRLRPYLNGGGAPRRGAVAKMRGQECRERESKNEGSALPFAECRLFHLPVSPFSQARDPKRAVMTCGMWLRSRGVRQFFMRRPRCCVAPASSPGVKHGDPASAYKDR